MTDHGSPDTVQVGRDPKARPRWVVAAAIVAVLAGAAVVVGHAAGGHDAAATPTPGAGTSRAPAGPSPTRQPAVQRPREIVPWRDLRPGHPVFRRDGNGVLVTPYDQVSATGTITGRLHGGDTLVFDVVLESPGLVSLHPCPDYTITFGTHHVTRRLNCDQVPYFASLVRPDGHVTTFRPVLPAGTEVAFRMAVVVPEAPGTHRVLWSLDGPQGMPGFSGTVRVS